MSEIQIARIAADDESALLTWNDVMRTAYTHDRTAAWWRSVVSALRRCLSTASGCSRMMNEQMFVSSI